MSATARPLSASTAATSKKSKFSAHLAQLNHWVAPVAMAGILVGCAPAATLQTMAPPTPVVTTAAATVETAPLVELPPIPMLDDEAPVENAGPADQKGVASWYGPGFHGRLTANGERYNMGELTAAHRNYAFGTRLCVRSASNGKTVVVRVNDRGPYAKGRVLDLSKAAAQELGMLGVGVKRVEIWKLDENEDDCPDSVVAQG